MLPSERRVRARRMSEHHAAYGNHAPRTLDVVARPHGSTASRRLPDASSERVHTFMSEYGVLAAVTGTNR